MFSTTRNTLSFIILITLAIPSFTFAGYVKYQQTSDTGLSYELTIESESPEVMKPLPVSLIVSNSEGSPITGAQIKCSLSMPAMAMPSNMPPIRESKILGQYNGIFLLTMGGLWHAELTLSYSDGKQDTVVIPIPGVMSDGSGSDVDTKLESLFQEEKGASK